MRVPGVWPGLPRPAPSELLLLSALPEGSALSHPISLQKCSTGGEGLKAMLPWPPNTGASEPPTRTRVRVREGLGTCCQVRGLSASREAAGVERSLLEGSWSG